MVVQSFLPVREAGRRGAHPHVSSPIARDVIQHTARRKEKTRSYVMGGVRMIVDSSKECRGRVFPNVPYEKMASARVLVKEVRYVVNEARN